MISDGVADHPVRTTRATRPGETVGDDTDSTRKDDLIRGGTFRIGSEDFYPARQGETIDTSTGHIGFRCVVRASRIDDPD